MSNLNLLLKLRYDGKEVSSGANQSVADLRRIEQQTRTQIATNQQAASSVNTITGGYHAMAAAMGTVVGIGTAQKIVNDTASAQLLESRLQSLSGTTADYAANQEYLFATADKLNVSYEALAGSFTSMLNLQRSGTVTMTEGKAITEGLVNAGAALGASNDQLANSLYGLNQALSSGVLQTDELNQVMDPLPGLLGELDKQVAKTGMTFRQLTGTGQVTSAMFKQYLIEALKSYEGAAERTEGKITASFAEMGNAYAKLIREYEKEVNFGVVAVAGAITSSMNALRENQTLVEGLTVSATALALVLAGRMVGSLTMATVAKFKDIQATKAQALAEKERLAGVMQTATVEHARAVQMREYYTHNLKAAQSDHFRGVAITNLAAANGRAIVTERALTAATANYTAVATQATLVSRALTSAMSLIGGLPGLLTIAAIALVSFASANADAAVEVKDFDSKVQQLSENLQNLSNKQKEARLVEIKGEMLSVGKAAEQTRAEISKLQQELVKGRLKAGGNASIVGPIVLPLTDDERQSHQDRLALLERDAEAHETHIKRLQDAKKQLNAPTQSSNALKPAPLPNNIQQLQVELLGEEAKIRDSYQRRRDMVSMSMASDAANKQKYTQILKDIDAAEHKALAEQGQKARDEKIRAENEARRKVEQDKKDAQELSIAQARGFATREAAESYANTLAVEQAKIQARQDANRRVDKGLEGNDQLGELRFDAAIENERRAHEKRLLAIQGFKSKEAAESYSQAIAVEQAKIQGTLDAQRRGNIGLSPQDAIGELKYNVETEKLRMAREQQLLLEQGFQSQREADAAAHEERLFQIRAEKTGQLRGTVVQFANFERKTTAEKTGAILELGEQGFKAMASQSKTAFKAYKAFSIGQALIKTYESATGAFAALAPIPVIGPALGAAAAAAAVAMGMGQVRMIQQQQPAGIAHGGLDYVPSESTYVLQRGERVLSPRQNVEISEQVRRIDERSQSQGSGGNVNLTVAVHSQGGVKANAQMEQKGDRDYIVNLFLSDVQNGGEMARTMEQTYQLKRAG
jgi:tape measure domain-containing protein